MVSSLERGAADGAGDGRVFFEVFAMSPEVLPIHHALPPPQLAALYPPPVPHADPMDIAAAARRGDCPRALAAMFGISKSQVYRICQQEGIALKSGLSPDTRRRIIGDARAGKTLSELTRVYGTTYYRIRKILDHADSQPLKDSSRRVLKAVALLQNTDKTFAEIGKELETSGQRIHQIYCDAGDAGLRFANREK